MNKQRDGFTLMELMVTIAILAVLTMVALASYKYYIRRARAEEAKELLLGIQMSQEQYFGTYSVYVSSGADESAIFPSVHAKLASGSDDPSTWDWSAALGNCATPTGAQLGWCHLGFRPQGNSYFRAVTIGWNKSKGSTAPSSNYQIVKGMDFTRRWWYAVAHADLDQDGTLSTFIVTSQYRGIIEINEVE